MKTKEYTSISLPQEIIQELNKWQKAYEYATGIKLTKEKLLKVVLEKHRRFLWRDKNQGREIVTCYKAIKLAEREKIKFKTAYQLVKDHDEDTSSGMYYTRRSYYVYDKDIDGI